MFARVLTILLLTSSLCLGEGDVDKKDPAWAGPTLAGLIILEWTATGVVEGMKFSGYDGFILEGDYHVYRFVQNANYLVIPIVASRLSPTKENLKLLLISNIIGWVVYERTMSYTMTGDFMSDRSRFRLFGNTYPRPAPVTQIGIGILLVFSIDEYL